MNHVHRGLDPSAVENLVELEAESPGLLAEILEIYRTQSPVYLADLRAAFAVRDAKAIRGSAHVLKGSSANIGASEVVRICREIESAPETADGGTVLVRLEREVELATAAFAAVVDSATAKRAA